MAIKKLNEIEKLKKKDALNQQEKEKITREAFYRNIVKPNADVQNGFENMSKKRKERLGEYCCDICFEDKDVCIRLDNHRIKHTFRLLKKKEGDNYTDSCNCRILICDYCVKRINGKCPTCRTNFTETYGLTKKQIIKMNSDCPIWKV